MWKRRTTFSEAMATIREAAAWLEQVANLGYSVSVK